MTGNVPEGIIPRDLLTGQPVVSGSLSEFHLKRASVHILEMEDVLFHLNSAVMMPSAPAGKSSTQGSATPNNQATRAQQDKISGIQALAIVYKQFEFDDRKRLLITAHTDTSGEPDFNFKLSELRAQNVQYILDGNREAWADVSKGRHKVEDYQQIMTFLVENPRWKWACDPLGIDNSWGSHTKDATGVFVDSYNEWLVKRSLAPPKYIPLSTDLPKQIDKNPKHEWPTEMWGAVYDLYEFELAAALQALPEALETRYRPLLKFSDYAEETKYVSCGESFPIDSARKSNYRSQTNRRVELLFFDKDEVPLIDCPLRTSSVHTESECPIWHKKHFEPIYINPEDLNRTAYHLRFTYYDRVSKQAADVPDGLAITAIEDGNKVIENVEPVYSSGVYAVKVPNNPARKSIHFTFKETGKWAYTESSSKTPQMVTKTKEVLNNEISEIAKVSAVDAAKERLKYYDLPEAWDSRNWRCAVGGKIDDFENHVKTPTKASDPIVFNLDDIVLIDSAGSQALKDRNGDDDPIDLSIVSNPGADPPEYPSRVRILFVDQADYKLKIYETNPGGSLKERHESSIIKFQANSKNKPVNLIKDPPGNARAVVFCCSFYDVAATRTADNPTFKIEKGHILGARAAVLNDTEIHHSLKVKFDQTLATVHCAGIGNFDLHYLHNGGVDDDHNYSYLIMYWSAFLTKDTKPTVGGTGNNRPATDAEVEEFKSVGMINAMDHWNKKEYQFEDHSKASKMVVRPFFMFEINEAFSFKAKNPVDFEDDDYKAAFNDDNFAPAVTAARGGRPKAIAFVVRESKGSYVVGNVGADRPFSIVCLRIKTRTDDTARFSGYPFNEFSDPGQYGCLVIAHELGHCSGQNDDYKQNVPGSFHFGAVPTFGQFGRTSGGSRINDNNANFPTRTEGSEAYEITHDFKTMMVLNGPIRMRHVWRFNHWLNEEGKTGKPLNKFTSGAQHEISYPRASLTYFRDTTTKLDPWVFSHSSTLTVSPNRTMNVYLFQSLDETRVQNRPAPKTNIEFKAILAVRPLLSISFAAGWSNTDKKDWVEKLDELFNDTALLAGKYMLSGGGGNLDPTIIRFIPGYDSYASGGAPAHTAFNLRIAVNNSAGGHMAQAGKILTMDNDVTERELLNYLFGKPRNAASFAVADFNFIKTWFSGPDVGNGTFIVGEV